MSPFGVFLNDAGRLRSGWRVGIFVLVFLLVSLLLAWLIRIGFVLGHSVPLFSHPLFNDLTYRFTLLVSAVLAAWVCLRFIEGLPLHSLGLGLHHKWWWDLLMGSLIGIASLLIAALIAFAAGGLRFTFSGSNLLSSTLRSLLASGVLFVVGALAEEAMFRGYPLQTLTRAKLAWLGILLTSLPFALVHLNNPNVVAGFTFINTALAGLWLARALGLELGAEFSVRIAGKWS
jgi:membrane protease YdiL (CAAX protease family)